MTQPTYPQPAPPQPPQGKPGYYPDNQGAMRWWTGAGWTDHIMGQGAVAQPAKKKPSVVKWVLITVGIPVALLASCTAALVGGGSSAPSPSSVESTASGSASTTTASHRPRRHTNTRLVRKRLMTPISSP